MEKSDLEQKKKQLYLEHQLLKDKLKVQESIDTVKEYLLDKEQLINNQNCQDYISKLEIGEDGTVFEKSSPDNKKHYGLSYLVNCALTLKYLGIENKLGIGLTITFKELSAYLENAQLILSENRKYEKDSLVENAYGLEIYRNPKNIQILTKEENEELEDALYKSEKNYTLNNVLDKYNVNRSIIYRIKYPRQDSTIMVVSNDVPKLNFVNPETLSAREKEAFFGETAQKILNVKIDSLNYQTSSNKLLSKKIN